jgi:hypothetical protein
MTLFPRPNPARTIASKVLSGEAMDPTIVFGSVLQSFRNIKLNRVIVELIGAVA